MSRILGTVNSTFAGQMPARPEDRRTSPQFDDRAFLLNGPDVLWDRGGFIPAGSTGVGGGVWGNISSWGENWYPMPYIGEEGKMGQRRQGISGVTRDSSGNPLGGCTVKAFDVANHDLVVDSVTSDANGNYTVTTPFDGSPMYAWTYKAGTPVQGALPPTTPA